MYKSNWIPAILTLIMVSLVSYAVLVDDKPDCKQKQLAEAADVQNVMGHDMYHASEGGATSTMIGDCS